jgi:hypothetical protein
MSGPLVQARSKSTCLVVLRCVRRTAVADPEPFRFVEAWRSEAVLVDGQSWTGQVDVCRGGGIGADGREKQERSGDQ